VNLNPILQFPVGARLIIGFALVWMACSRGSGTEPAQPPAGAQPASPSAPGPTAPPDEFNNAAGMDGTNSPATAGDPAAEKSPEDPAARPSGTGVLVCDKYIRMVCSCAQKRQNPDLQRACDLSKQSLPEWQKSHKEEGEELAVVKACQRAFLYIQSTGQCDDISY